MEMPQFLKREGAVQAQPTVDPKPAPAPAQAKAKPADANAIKAPKQAKAEKAAAKKLKLDAKKLAAKEKIALKRAQIKALNDAAKAKKVAKRAEAKKLREEKAAARKLAKLTPTPAQIEKAKAAAEAKILKDAKAAVKAEATKELVPLAKEINVRIDKANKLDHDADDHRLAAALQLEQARKRCELAGINFKTWTTENVQHWTYQTVRKLAKVGGSENPTQALTDMREGNAAANKKSRAAKKASAKKAAAAPAEAFSGIEGLKVAFGHLKASEKMTFAAWVAGEVGATLDDGLGGAKAA
jgi:hypothetical protein